MKILDLSIGEELWISEFVPVCFVETDTAESYEPLANLRLELALADALTAEPSRAYYYKVYDKKYDATKDMYVWSLALLFNKEKLPPWVDIISENPYIDSEINKIILVQESSILKKAMQVQAQQYNQQNRANSFISAQGMANAASNVINQQMPNMYNQQNAMANMALYGNMYGGMNGNR